MKKHWMALRIFAKTEILFLTACVLLLPSTLLGQIYHLRSDVAVDGAGHYQLLSAAPIHPVLTIPTPAFMTAPGDYPITDFETISGVPNASGYISANSTFSFSLWMHKTLAAGLAYPKAAIYLNSQSGTLLCATNGTTALTTTFTQIAFNCQTRVAVTMAASDRFYLWVGASVFAGGDPSLKAELNIEGTPGGNYDSTVTVTLPTAGPTITGIRNAQTNEATAAIGGTVIISGSGFGSSQGNSVVSFNGIPAAVCTSSTCWAPDGTSITATVPTGVTTGNVTVNVNGVNSNGVSLTIVPPPVITGVTPRWIPVGGPMTINGSNFGTNQGVVTISGTAATITGWTSTAIGITVPNITPNVFTTATVSASGVTSSPFQFATHYAPAINGQPNGVCLVGSVPGSGTCVTQGAIGALVNIFGSNFGRVQPDASVTFGDIAATQVTQTGAEFITAAIPQGVPTGTGVSVRVTVDQVPSNTIAFTPLLPPAINANGLSPASCSSGTTCEGVQQVMISGSNFGSTTGTVSFNGALAQVASWGTNTITATVPVGSGTGPVVVNANGASSSGVNFVVLPNINSPLVPSSGPVSTVVTINGTGFGSTPGSVAFNSTQATPTAWSDTRITVPVPAGVSTGNATVTVTASGTPATASFTVTASPAITNLSTSSGPTGTPVGINGSAFGSSQGSGVVRFNNYPAQVCTSCTVCNGGGGWSPTCIAATVPNAATTGPVTVTVNSGQTAIGPQFMVTGLGTGQISGTVSCTAGPTVTVQALVQGVSQGSPANINCNAPYTVSNLPAGSYDVQASAPGYGAATQNAVPVTLGGTTSGINFNLDVAGTITGQITKASGGAPINQATINVYVGNAQVASVNTGATNTYTINTLNAGTYRVQASATDPVTGPYVTQTQVVTLTAGGTATQNFALQSPGTPGNSILYSYDNLGRLVTVRDQGGDTAVYSYDAVGNITAIDRRGGSQVTILSLDHPTAATGSTLTITGTGFSSNPSQDTVVFTGASVAAGNATPTQLTVTVPSMAMTGPLSVNVNGTLSNSLPFTVLASSAPPTITAVGPPTIGVTGTSFPVTGMHFDADPNKDLWRLNATPLMVTGGGDPTTTVNTAVPANTASGHVSVRTPAGMAVSTEDFIVPLPGHPASDVAFSNRIQFPGTGNVANLPAGKIAMLLFDAAAGQRVTINITSSSITSCALFVYAPNNTEIGSVASCGSTGYLPTYQLPSTGTYTIGISAPFTGTNNITLTLSDATDFTSPITFGQTVTVPLNTVGQTGRLAFFATAGKHISVQFTHPAWANGCTLALFGPANQNLQPTDVSTPYHLFTTQDCSAPTFWDIGYLPQLTGVYTIVITPVLGATGTMTVTLVDSSDKIPAPIALTTQGTQTSVSTDAAGQNVQQGFAGTAGQKISLYVSSANPVIRFWIIAPGNILLTNAGTGSTYFFDPRSVNLVLPSTGNYTILVDPTDDRTGSATFTLYQVVDATATTLNVPGTPGASVMTTAPANLSQQIPGQTVTFPFTASVGQNVALQVDDQNGIGCYFAVYDPDNRPLPSFLSAGYQNVPCAAPGAFRALPDPIVVTGTYTVVVQPAIDTSSAWNTGFFKFTLTNAQDNSYTISPTTTGSQLTVSNTIAGQNDVVTFQGAAGQRISMFLNSVSYTASNAGTITITGPAPSTQVLASASGSQFATGQTINLNPPGTLPADGIYTIFISPGSANSKATGSTTFTLTSQ